MIFREVLAELESLAPLKYALAYDNTGFQVGRMDKEIKKVCLATDITDDVIKQAAANGADLLLTHHPLIFDPLLRVAGDDVAGRRIMELVRNDINYMAMHTNFDVMAMADYAADILGLSGRKILDVTYEEGGRKEGIGRYGNLPDAMELTACADYVKSKFNLASVRVFGAGGRMVKIAAISPGSSSNVLPFAIKAGADVLITGDIKHSMALDALAQGICLIDAGHYGTEKIFVRFMNEYIGSRMPGLAVVCAEEGNPFYVV
jgi:dinuclear metal center YbgI/SA1388 family protein